jgi:nucleotide-binding universal stress UspA family protein
VPAFLDVLVPIQFDAAAPYALDVAVRLAEPGGRVRLLHVVEWGPSVVEGAILAVPHDPREVRSIHESSRRTLERYAERCAGVRVEVEVVEGRADLAILEAARAGPADLLVLGRGRRHGLVGLRAGGVVSRVLLGADCPVLLVPH